jgi:hypothetical protein
MKIGKWSTNAGSNNATPPDGWPEGQAPSTINDCAREMMAAIRTYVQDAQFFDPDNTPSYLSATSFSLNAVDTVTFQAGRRIKMFDATTLYGFIDGVTGTTVTVRLDSGALTASLSSVAVSCLGDNPSALPESTYRRNVIINGNMDVWQRSANIAPANSTNTYTADRWMYLQSSTAAVHITRADRSATPANVPTVAQCGMVLTNSLRISVSAVDATMAAGEFGLIQYRMEGLDWRQVAHRPNIASFWANSNRSGVYALSVRNHAGSASYVQNFTISAVNTWSRFAFTIPEAPTNVTWNFNNSAAMLLTIALAAGTTHQGGEGNWTAANIIATGSQTNFLASAGNVIMFTGFQFEVGTRATPIEQKFYADELARCQRYYWRGLPFNYLAFPSPTVSSHITFPIKFPTTMRVAPSMSKNFTGAVGFFIDDVSLLTATEHGVMLQASATQAQPLCYVSFGSNDTVVADAEL